MNVIHALFRRFAALTFTFALGVSATMLWVYSLPDEELGSTRFDLAQAKENALLWWYQPHAFMVFASPRPKMYGNSACRPNVFTLVVSVSKEEQINLNGKELGTLEDTSRLKATFSRIFQERRVSRAYKEGIELRPDFADIPEDERVEKTVFVKADKSLKYSDILALVDELKGAGADPIVLQTSDYLYWSDAESHPKVRVSAATSY